MNRKSDKKADSRRTDCSASFLERNSRRFALIGLDIFCYLIAYTMGASLEMIAENVPTEQWLPTMLSEWKHLVLLLLMLLVGRYMLSVYRNVWRYPNARAYISMVIADSISGVLFYLITYALVWIPAHTDVYLGFWRVFSAAVLFDLGTLIMRFAYQAHHQRKHMAARDAAGDAPLHKIGVAIVGAGQVGVHLAEELRTSTVAHYRPVCFIDRDVNKIGYRVADLKVYAEDEHIIDKLRTLPVQEIFVAIPNLDPEESQHLIKFYTDAGYKVKRYDFPIWDANSEGEPPSGARRMVRDFRMEDLLGRESLEKKINSAELKAYYRDRVILVTGGGGSIGSELCRQIAKCHPKKLIVLDIYENNAYDIQQELRRKYGDKLDLCVEIASVRDPIRLDAVFNHYRPEIVFHAAAHKHVPLMEHSSCEAIKNNVMGTYNTANMAEKYGAEKFVLISTDKAVNPTNVMGASKRMCEMVVQCRTDSRTAFTAVRFGNVLGSNGSVIPLFRAQIEMGGPVTLTDKRIIRYFMTIPEASRLVMQAGSMAKDGELFVLDMGKQVKILDMAENMIRMMGYTPYKDIDIVEVGLRPGEKLYEELLIRTDDLQKTDNNLIFIETDAPPTREEVDAKLADLMAAVKASETDIASPLVKEALQRAVPTFHEPAEVNALAAQTREMQEAYATEGV